MDGAQEWNVQQATRWLMMFEWGDSFITQLPVDASREREALWLRMVSSMRVTMQGTESLNHASSRGSIDDEVEDVVGWPAMAAHLGD